MNGQAKVELLLELKNKLRTGLNQAKRDTFKGVNDMQTKLNSLKFNLAKNSKAIVDEVPLIGNAFRLAKNPIALTAAGIVAIGKGIDYTTQKAADFNTQFRQLSNLNLDKSRKEINSLRRMVMDTAFDKGFDSEKTIMGYFDVQSTTGKYGNEVKRIVEKQGEFANLMQADFNNYIAGTAKGMANFGFGADKLEEFNRSAYATVKVGVTTFDQLAQVQSVYAGAAASNNQTFDTANKLLALFTVKTKSVDEAATLTKSMFNDLTKDTTIKAFKKVGISIYDNNGKIKQADSLMLELNKKFAGIDKDSKIVALKNQFSGSEGLIAMIQAATDKSGQLQSTFDNFNSTKLDMNKAINIAKNDTNYQNEQLRNRIKVLEISIGESLLPIINLLTEIKLALVTKLSWFINGKDKNKTKMYSEGWTTASNTYGNILDSLSSMNYQDFTAKHSELTTATKIAKGIYFDEVKKIKDNKSIWSWLTSGFQSSEERSIYADQYAKGKWEYLESLSKGLFSEWKKRTNNGAIIKPKPTPDEGSTTNTNALADSVDTVTGSARQVRNLTVNIDAFNKGGINTQNTSLQHMDGSQIEAWFTEMCMRVIRSVETSF